jgi:hypothetical protein
MDIRPSEKVRDEIKRLYNRDPRKWHVLVGRDSRGYTSTVFLHGDKMWTIKEEPLNPYESIGCGSRVMDMDEGFRPFLKNPYSFGFRPISEKYLRDILEAGITDKAVRKMLGKTPVPERKITSPAIMGPITLPTEPIDFVSEKQLKLDAALSKELDKMIYKKRPDLLLPYV